MDSRAFDELSRKLAEKTSRGRALKLFGGALVGTLAGAGSASAHPPEKHCKYARYSCQRNIDCCSNNCCNRICCDDGQTCCGGECITCPAGQTVDPITCQCTGGGGGGECTSPDQCPQAPLGSCQTAACVAGTCTFVDDPENVPSCGECSTGMCMGSDPVCVPAPAGTPCSTGFCDGAGQCIGAGVCPPGSDACFAPTPACSANPACVCLIEVDTGMSACVDATPFIDGPCPVLTECSNSGDCGDPATFACVNVTGCCPTLNNVCLPRCF